MASAQDVADARRRFEIALDADPATTSRIFGWLTTRYREEIAGASRPDLLVAASWAARRLQQRFPAGRLETATVDEITGSLVEGCPLCGGGGGSPGPSSTFVPPVEQPAKALA